MTLAFCFCLMTVGVSAQSFGAPGSGNGHVTSDADYFAVAKKVKVEYVITQTQLNGLDQESTQALELRAKLEMYEKVLSNLRSGLDFYTAAEYAYQHYARLRGITPNLANQEFVDLYTLINS